MADNRGFGVVTPKTGVSTSGETPAQQQARIAQQEQLAADAAASAKAQDAQTGGVGGGAVGGVLDTTLGVLGDVATAPFSAAAAGAGAIGRAVGGAVGNGTGQDAGSTNDVTVARQQRDQLISSANGTTTRPAPTSTAPTIAATPGAVAADVGTAAQSTTPTVGPAAQIGAVPQVSAGPVSAAQIGAAAQYGPSTVAPTAGATAGQAAASNIDTSQQQQFRAAQTGLVSQLQGAANGTAPSAAEAMLQRANDQAIATQKGLEAGAHGTSRLTQRLLGAGNIADLQQKNALDTAQVRAQEQATARGQLGTALEGARGQDIGLATTGAQLATDVSKTNAGLTTNVAISNADRAAAANMKDAELQQAAAAGNAAAKNEIAQRQAELTTGTNSLSEQLKLQAAQSNQGADVTVAKANADAQNQLTQLQAQIASQNGIANADQANQLQKLQAQLSTGVSTSNAANAADAAKAQAQIDLQTRANNLDAQLRQQGLNDAQRAAKVQEYLTSQQQILSADTAANALRAGAQITPKDILNGIATGGATIASTISDQRVKREVKPVRADAVKNLASKLADVQSWRYDGALDDGHEHFGVMAQDLEKDPLGAKLVREDAKGLKSVDYQGLTALLLSAALKGKRAARGL